jgi:hypothetical protein
MWNTLLLCAAAGADAPGDRVYVERVRPLLEARCVSCHSGDEPEGELDLERLEPAIPARERAWNAVRRRVRAGEMPPLEKPALVAEDRADLLAWLDEILGPEVVAADASGPALRRLNRREYANTIRDLFGVSIEADELPADEVGHGFDTIGAVLSTSELLVETHLRLAERVAERAVLLPDPPEPPRERVVAAKMGAGKASNVVGKSRGLYSNGAITLTRKLPRDGDYALRVRAHGDQAGDEPCRLAIQVGKREVARADVPERAPDARTVEAYLRLLGGSTKFAVAFLNDYFEPTAEDPAQRDRNLIVEWFEIEGPLDRAETSRFQREELDPATRGTLDDVIARLLARAWRRPVDAAEVERVSRLAAEAPTFEERVRRAIVVALSSPNFLYRPERPVFDADYAVMDPHAIATRLAYFLWSSTPDGELREAVDADRLRLREQVRRMIADPRSQALADGFAKQWLQLGRLERATPDPTRFPEFDEELRASMLAEATMLFDSVLRERRPARQLLDPGYTFVDERLARHYGIGGVAGTAMRRVPLEPGARGGVLGLAAVLTATSYPTRTSPSSRGKFVLEALLGAPPPPPPPGVGVLADVGHGDDELSLRERLEQHRTDASCAACHARIDPLGFGLENLDAIGRWRSREGRHDIDARGELPDGRAFSGPAELKATLARDPAFVQCLVRELAIYALGRSSTSADDAWIRRAIAAAGRDPTLFALIEELVDSPEFQRP